MVSQTDAAGYATSYTCDPLDRVASAPSVSCSCDGLDPADRDDGRHRHDHLGDSYPKVPG